MTKNIQYRWAIKTDNVYAFLGHNYVSTLASYKNEVSGIISKNRLGELEASLIPYGYSFTDGNIKLITTKELFKNWNKYH